MEEPTRSDGTEPRSRGDSDGEERRPDGESECSRGEDLLEAELREEGEPVPQRDVPKGHRSGFVSIVGRPNSGKSTLLNRLVNQKVAIVTPVPQTTRHRILGVRTGPDFQVIYVDTPGIHKPLHEMNRRMLRLAYESLEGVDLVLLLADVTQSFGSGDRFVVDRLKEQATSPVFLVLTKVDAVKKGRILEAIDTYRELMEFGEYIPISAETDDGIDILEERIRAVLPEGPRYYPEDFITDLTQRFRFSETIREEVFLRTREEVPHATVVTVDNLEEKPEQNLVVVDATIHVEKQGQKGILIGAGGKKLKEIGTAARKKLEEIYGVHVYLNLWVRVSKKWRENPAILDRVLNPRML